METWAKIEITHHQQSVLHLSHHRKHFGWVSTCVLPLQSYSRSVEWSKNHRRTWESQWPTPGWWHRRQIGRWSCDSTEVQVCSWEDIQDKPRPCLQGNVAGKYLRIKIRSFKLSIVHVFELQWSRKVAWNTHVKQYLKYVLVHNTWVNVLHYFTPLSDSMQECRVWRDLSWHTNKISLTFSPTCNEPAESEEVQEGHAGRGQDEDILVLPRACGVGQRQREEAGHSQHYQVDGDVGLYWTTTQMCSPYDVGVQNRKKCQN